MGLRCSFGLTEDEGFVCCGDSLGELHFFDAATGKRTFSLGPYRLSKPVAACQVREGSAEVYAVLGDGFIFQWAVPHAEHELEDEPLPPPPPTLPAPALARSRAAGEKRSRDSCCRSGSGLAALSGRERRWSGGSGTDAVRRSGDGGDAV